MKKILFYAFSIMFIIGLYACQPQNGPSKPDLKVSTDSVLFISVDSAVVKVSFVDGLYQGEIKELGLCYCTYDVPDYTCEKIKTSSTSLKEYDLSITHLQADQTYYVRAYAATYEGIYYGNILSFITRKIEAPKVTTLQPQSYETSVQLSAQLDDNGGDIKTRFGVCWASHAIPTIADNKVYLSISNNQTTIYYLEPDVKYYVRAFAVNAADTIYGDEIEFGLAKPIVYTYIEGAINAPFSIGSETKVAFSKGNLNYRASDNTWKFADEQYTDYCSNSKNPSSTSTDWIDMFGWGSSGYITQPYTWSSSSTYGPESDLDNTQSDWGIYNAISNGGNQAGLWYTMSYLEWGYLLSERTNAANLRGYATIDGKKGLIILPDNWKNPQSSSFDATTSSFTKNSYTVAQWKILEEAGAVFLPLNGTYYEKTFMEENTGLYWTSTYDKKSNKYCAVLKFSSSNGIETTATILRCCRMPVRLVTELIPQ